MNFKEIVNKITNLQTNDVDNIVSEMDVNDKNFHVWEQEIKEAKEEKINPSNLPFLIDSLYRSEDNYKFKLSLIIIREFYYELPYITNLENYIISDEKYNMVQSILVDIFSSYDNGISDCMALIILNKDPSYSSMTEEDKEKFFSATKRKLLEVAEYIATVEDIHPSAYSALEIYIDLLCYMDDSYRYIQSVESLNLDHSCKLFVLKYKIINNKPINEVDIRNIFKNKRDLCRTIRVFENLNAEHFIPKDLITQKDVAFSEMIDWLSYPTELGCPPDEINVVGTIKKNGYKYYVFEFKSTTIPDKKAMIGVSGGYKNDDITDRTYGFTFSEFDEIETNWQQQAEDLVSYVEDYAKEAISDLKD